MSYERRKLLASLGLTGVAGLAGCGGDGGGDGSGDGGGDGGGGTTTAGPGTGTSGPGTGTSGPGTGTDGPTEDPGNGETTDPGGEDHPFVDDRLWAVYVRPPGPPIAQYNPYNGTTGWAPGGSMMRFKVMQKSFVNGEFQPEVAKNWSYTGNILDIEFYDDHYYTTDTVGEINPWNITVDDFIEGTYEFRQYMNYPQETIRDIERIDKQDDYHMRLYFSDTFREEYILGNSLSGFEVENLGYFQDDLEEFRDMTTGEAIDEKSNNIYTRKVLDPNPFTSVPFRVESSTDTSWRLTLRNDDQSPDDLRWRDEINWQNCEIRVSGETRTALLDYLDGNLPYAGSEMGGIGAVDEDVPFNTEVARVPRPHATGAYVFNVRRDPMNSVHFRRAFMYMMNRQEHATRFMDPDQYVTGFLTQDREENYISDEMMEILRNAENDNYGVDEAMVDEAEREMEKGGFVRDSQGRWLHKEGENAGNPMNFQVRCYPWQVNQANNATSFSNRLADFGITMEVAVEDDSSLWGKVSDGQFDISLLYWGGGFPTMTYTNAFWGNQHIFGSTGFPGDWEGPAVGDWGEFVEGEEAEMETFNLANMVNRLQISRNDQLYQELTDRLAWVYNQCLPRAPIGFQPRTFVMNTDQWDWPLPFDEHPFAWVSLPRRKLWQRGVIKAKPTEE